MFPFFRVIIAVEVSASIWNLFPDEGAQSFPITLTENTTSSNEILGSSVASGIEYHALESSRFQSGHFVGAINFESRFSLNKHISLSLY